MLRHGTTLLAIVFFAAFVVLAPPAAEADTCGPGFGLCTPSAVEVYANPHWSIQLTSFGYSDFIIFQLPPFPRWNPADPFGPAPIHEMISGEWAFAVSYDGGVIWLEPCFVYPDWLTNSNFVVEVPLNFPGDSDGDGMLEGFSIISNPDLRIRIDYDYEYATDGTDLGTAMGLGALGTMMTRFRLSDPYVLEQRFELENISGKPLNDVRLYGMVAAHPANTEYPGSSGAYDMTFYPTGGFPGYFWDLSIQAFNSGITDGTPTGSTFDDVVSYSVDMTPAAFDLDTYKGHQFGDDGLTTDVQDALDHGLKPLCGTHCNIENKALNNQTLLTGEEVSAGFRLDAGSLAPGATWNGNVLLAVASTHISRSAPACAHIIETGGQPTLRLGRGACTGGSPTALSYDVAMGSTFDLFRVAPCGSGPNGDFDCSALINLACKAKQHALDRLTLDDDAPKADLLYYLARPSGNFTSWGEGNNGGGSTVPLLRFYFTSQTAPGIDVCGPISFSAETQSPVDSPGIGSREKVGLGVAAPARSTGLP